MILLAAIVLSSFARRILTRLLTRLHVFRDVSHSKTLLIVQRIRRPAQFLVICTGIGLLLPLLDLPEFYLRSAQKTTAVAWFLILGWLAITVVYCFEDFLLLRYDVSVADNLGARRARTQLQLMRRMVIVLLLLVDAGLILSVFRDSQLWHYGAGLLASAGLASLVLATAAKSSASNLLAGLQIALTEPIRLDDVVIVEGEWGRIEEITTTYVVVAIWDQRRLVVPLSYFIENPFQNWTRKTSDLLGYPIFTSIIPFPSSLSARNSGASSKRPPTGIKESACSRSPTFPSTPCRFAACSAPPIPADSSTSAAKCARRW